jgi:predicted nucleotidyltransferase/plasmid maintenance system antidote protein VapI
MSTTAIGNKLRKLREEKKMPLRKVAAIIDVDVAILSKMERGERRLTKDIVKQLAKLYKHNEEELMILFLSDKVLNEIGDEALALKALQVAEEQLEYKVFLKTDRKYLVQKLKEVLSQFSGIEKAWIYGSFARKDEGPKSDIDLAIKASRQFSYFDIADVQYKAELAIGKKVDVGFIDSFKAHIMQHVKSDLKLIYEKG